MQFGIVLMDIACDWKDYLGPVQDWSAYRGRKIKNMMTTIMSTADFLCTTPANTERKPVFFWKTKRARGLAVDEAGNSMSIRCEECSLLTSA
jgi:hypothetical protein